MRRIQIYITEDQDERLQAEAVTSGTSKASLIRECIELRYESEAEVQARGSRDALDDCGGMRPVHHRVHTWRPR